MNNHNLFYEILNGVHTEQISSKIGGDHIGRTQQNSLLTENAKWHLINKVINLKLQ